MIIRMAKTAAVAALTIGFVAARRERNRLRKELTETREELTVTKVQCVEQTARAVRAEETLGKVLPGGTSTDQVPSWEQN